MNVPMLLNLKRNTTWLSVNDSISNGLLTLKGCGFSAVPVLCDDGTYYGTVYSSDFLDYILLNGIHADTPPVAHIVRQGKNPAVLIDAALPDIFDRLLETNFVPVVDGRRCFVGIVTRKRLMNYLKKERIAW